VLSYVVRRVLYAVPVVLVASFLLFVLVRATFDPTARLRASRDNAAVIAREKERLGLDRPLVVQYGDWLGDFVQGDWGQSERTRDDVLPTIRRALWTTFQLIFWGILLAAIVAVLVGVFSAVRQYSALDYTLTALAFVGLALPPFWFGLMASEFLGIQPREWFGLTQPIFYTVGLHSADQSGFDLDYLRHLFLPVLTLTVQIIAGWSRYQRSAMLDVLSADYIRTARAKGVPRRRVILRHGLRNALIPLVTVMALDIGLLFGGVIVTETIFSIPGMGRLFYDSLLAGDATMLTAWGVVVALFVVSFNVLADVVYGWLDPRIRVA
jgi:peptide/nickel transport system permease protein